MTNPQHSPDFPHHMPEQLRARRQDSVVGLDYINPSRREVAGWLLLSEFRTDFVQGFDSVH